jgi:hypothetical protein
VRASAEKLCPASAEPDGTRRTATRGRMTGNNCWEGDRKRYFLAGDFTGERIADYFLERMSLREVAG